MSAKHTDIRDEIQEQKQKFKDMTTRKKWEYFWEYYKIHTIVTIFAVILIVTFARDMIAGNKEPFLSIAMVNGYPSIDANAFMEEFALSCNIDTEEYDVTLDTNYQYSQEEVSQMTMATTQKLVTMVSAQAIDAFVTDSALLENYARSGFFMDLRTVLPQDLLEKYKDSFYYYTFDPEAEKEYGGASEDENYMGPFGTTEPVPIAIQASSFSKLSTLGAYHYLNADGVQAEPYYAISANTKQLENAITFLRFLNP